MRPLIILLFCVFIYFLPSIIAKDKSFFTRLFVLNLLLGWTIVGWIIALKWSLKKE
jgi:hypothetical protein